MTERVEFPQSRCLLGVATGDITPPVGMYHRMWGAARQDQSTGIHVALQHTTLVMAPPDSSEPARDCVVFIGVDHCLLGATELQRITRHMATVSGVADDRIIVFFSHTHAAGLLADDRVDLPGGRLIPAYFESLANELGAGVRRALESIQAATLVYGTGHCGLATNRDYTDPDGRSVCGFNPDGTADATVVVARAHADSTGQPLAVVVNYACHPTTLAWDNTLISPDYIGAMRSLVTDSPDGASCLFLQGASGDIGPRHGFVGDVEVADRNGRQLGYAVLGILESLPAPGHAFSYTGSIVSGATIGTWDYAPIDYARRQQIRVWGSVATSCELPWRADLPRRDALQQERDRWEDALRQAEAAVDAEQAAEARAMLERIRRRFFLIGQLPDRPECPCPIRVWRFGDAVWVAVNGEPYNLLQTELRKQFPRLTIVVGTLANGSTVWYLPDRNSYGKGLYQEQASVLAQGSLERLIDALAGAIRQLTEA